MKNNLVLFLKGYVKPHKRTLKNGRVIEVRGYTNKRPPAKHVPDRLRDDVDLKKRSQELTNEHAVTGTVLVAHRGRGSRDEAGHKYTIHHVHDGRIMARKNGEDIGDHYYDLGTVDHAKKYFSVYKSAKKEGDKAPAKNGKASTKKKPKADKTGAKGGIGMGKEKQMEAPDLT